MTAWYSAVATQLRRRRHLFWHLPESQRSKDLIADLRASLDALGRVSVIDCRHLPATASRDLDVGRLDLAADVVVLLDFSHLIELDRGVVWLRQIRPPCMEVLDDGRCLLVISKRPQSVYPVVDGSSLATDCPSFVFDWDRHAPKIESSLARDSCGLVSVGSALDGWEGEPSERKQFHKQALRRGLNAAMAGCESTTIAWVTRNLCVSNSPWARDSHWVIRSHDLPDSVVYDLTAAGLARLDHGPDEVRIGDRVGSRLLKDAAIEADLRVVDPPRGWVDAAKGLFVVERLVRRAVAQVLEEKPHLRDKHLNAYRAKASENFKYETSVKEADPPNLLQWLDLTDVVNVATQLAESGTVGGMDVRQWTLIQRELVPVRNRIMHTRLPEDGDLQLVEVWRRRLRKGQ